MKKLKNKFLIIFLALIILLAKDVYANRQIKSLEFTEEYKKWLQLPEEKKSETVMPKMFNLPKTTVTYSNPLRYARMLGTEYIPKFSLNEKINITIKNQQNTKLCWAFSALSSLETNLALRDIKMNIEPKEYNFSEKHMDYSTVYYINETEQNKYGINRAIASRGNSDIAISYLTNGLGAVNEEDLPFDYEENDVTLSDIIYGDVATQVYDTIDLSYNPEKSTPEDLTKMQQQMKDHIMNYGSMSTDIYGKIDDKNVYNNNKGSLYCDNKDIYQADHSVSIIGWDDNYSKDNFVKKPTNDGAWIIRNSYGVKSEEYENIDEFKDHVFELFKDDPEFAQLGYETSSDIPDEVAKNMAINAGYKIREDGTVYYPIGNDGIMYVSYEDANIYTAVSGIIYAENQISYEKIYQYNDVMNCNGIIEVIYPEKVYIANIFDREKPEEDEFLNQISLYVPEKYTCKVYVNQGEEGADFFKTENAVVLENGETTKTIETAGYHTLKFKNVIPLKASKYSVVIEIQGTREELIDGNMEKLLCIPIESNYNEVETSSSDMLQAKELFKNINVTENKCFINYNGTEWKDMSKVNADATKAYRGDSTIKAFTVSERPEVPLDHIGIIKKPTKLDGYFEGDELNLTGIEVTAYYEDGWTEALSEQDFYLSDNSYSLAVGENTITITYVYGDITKTASFTVNATAKEEPSIKTIDHIQITKLPNKLEGYIEGDELDITGMEVTAFYTDGTSEQLNNYNVSTHILKAGTNEIIVTYNEKSDSFQVNASVILDKKVKALKIKTFPELLYIEGDSFNPNGMVIEVEYENGDKEEIQEGYSLINNNNLKVEQTTVTVEYGGVSIDIPISVERKTLQNIVITQAPTKTEYTEEENFEADGMIVKAVYQRNITENIEMQTQEREGYIVLDGENLKASQTYVTIKFEDKTAKQEITVKSKTDDPQEPQEPDKPKATNSNFDLSVQHTKEIRAYYYTNTAKKSFEEIDMEIDNIKKSEENDSYEYYYFVAPQKVEKESIQGWVKIDNAEINNGKLKFTINTKNLLDREKVSDVDSIYLYVKEVAKKGEDEKTFIYGEAKLERQDANIKIYLDDKLKETDEPVDDKDKDQTVAPIILPNTGMKIAIILAVIVLIYAIIKYSKYRKLKEIR